MTVTEEVWKELNKRRTIGQSTDDVLRDLLHITPNTYDGRKKDNKEHTNTKYKEKEVKQK